LKVVHFSVNEIQNNLEKILQNLAATPLLQRRGARGEANKRSCKIQVAIMAPTEILARQHFSSTQNLLIEFGLTSHLLVGSTTAKQKKEIKADLKTGNVDVVIGTHALVQEDVYFANLGFVVVDEQHRFGVKQREVLEK